MIIKSTLVMIIKRTLRYHVFTITWYGIHPAMLPQVYCKSKGQLLFSFLVFIGCSSGCNSGLGWASRLL